MINNFFSDDFLNRIVESTRNGFRVSIRFKKEEHDLGTLCGILLEKNGRQAGYMLPLHDMSTFDLQMKEWEDFCNKARDLGGDSK